MNLKLKSTNFVSDFLLTISLFFYIYSPDFSFLRFKNSGVLIFPIIILIYGFSVKPKYILYVLTKNKIIVIFQCFLFFLLLVSLILEGFHNSDITISLASRYPVSLIRFYIEVLMTSVAINAIFLKKRRNMNSLINILFLIVTIQFSITLISLVSPTIRDYINLYILNSDTKLVTGAWHYGRRGYGLASGHLFFYPLFNGFVVILALWCSLYLKKKITFLIISLVAFLPIIVNARIGIMSIPAFVISFILFSFKPSIHPKVFKFVLIFVCLFILGLFTIPFLTELNFLTEGTLRWLNDGMFQYQLILLGRWKEANTLNILLTNQIHLPRNFLIGEGQYLFQNSFLSFSSDIGYINYFYFGGFLYSILLYGSFIWISVKAIYKTPSLILKGTLLGGFVLIFVANFKGMIFNSNALMKGYFLIIIFIILSNSDKSTLIFPDNPIISSSAKLRKFN